MSASLGLRGNSGIVGFIPRDAHDSATDKVALEVVVEFEDGSSRNISMTTTRRELEEQVHRGATEGLRQFFRDRARNDVASANPLDAERIKKVASIFWVCRFPDRREPFLRF